MSIKSILIYGIFHRIISTNLSSRWVGSFANAKLWPPFLRFIIKRYISLFDIDMSEYDFDISRVKTFNQFFTRNLKDGARKWGEGLCSPVDGRMLSFGKIRDGMIFQVKGMNYYEAELTGQAPLNTGSFVNLYLSPANYHRVHAPIDMEIKKITIIPGKLLSVSKRNAANVDNLYIKNERLVLSGNSKYGTFHFVFVGALNVGSIKLSFMPEIKTNLKEQAQFSYEIENKISKGEELGYFEMGSTIIMTLETASFTEIDDSFLQKEIRLGENLYS